MSIIKRSSFEGCYKKMRSCVLKAEYFVVNTQLFDIFLEQTKTAFDKLKCCLLLLLREKKKESQRIKFKYTNFTNEQGTMGTTWKNVL